MTSEERNVAGLLTRRRRLLRAVAVGVTLAGILSLAAQGVLADGPTSVVVTSADDSAFPTVSTVVLAGQDGNPLPSLAASDVSVTENGKPAQVLSVTSSTDVTIPLELVLAIDTSGSMAGVTLPQAKGAATTLLKSLGSSDQAALISFDTQVRVDQPPTGDVPAVIGSVAALAAHGNTALYDAVGKAADLGSQAPGARRAVVLLTDGEDYGGLSSLTREQSLARAVASHTIFYTIGVGSAVDTAYLGQLADQSGGRFFLAPQASDLAAIYGAIQDRLRSYFVVVARSSAAAGGASRTIQVSIRAGAGGTGSLVYTSRHPDAEAPAPAAVAPPVTPAVVASAAPAASSVGSSRWPSYVGGFAVLLVPLAALALLFASRRRRANLRLVPATGAMQLGPVGPAPSRAPATSEAVTRQVTIRVRDNGDTRSYRLLSTLSVGIAPDNDVVLSVGSGAAPHHARLWLRDGQVMLHHLAANCETTVAGRTVEWASIEGGQEIGVGSAILEVTVVPGGLVMGAMGTGTGST